MTSARPFEIASTVEKIDQHVFFVEKTDKRALLEHVLGDASIERVLVFTRTKHGANRVAEGLARVRIGVGKPPGRTQGVDHVLNRPGKADRAALDVAIEEAADAVEAILAEGVEAAMTRFNQRT